jgi:hypothetical protein
LLTEVTGFCEFTVDCLVLTLLLRVFDVAGLALRLLLPVFTVDLLTVWVPLLFAAVFALLFIVADDLRVLVVLLLTLFRVADFPVTVVDRLWLTALVPLLASVRNDWLPDLLTPLVTARPDFPFLVSIAYNSVPRFLRSGRE